MLTYKTTRIKYTTKLELAQIIIMVPSQPMFTPYQRDALDSMFETANHTMAAMPVAPVRSRIHFHGPLC